MEGKAHMAIGWVAAQPITVWLNGLVSVEDKAHQAIAGAIRWVAAQPSFAYANHFNLLLIPLIVLYRLCGAPSRPIPGRFAGR